jgi:hypothetical protein
MCKYVAEAGAVGVAVENTFYREHRATDEGAGGVDQIKLSRFKKN